MPTNQIADVVQQVQDWPVPMRITLARQILQSVELEHAKLAAQAIPRGPSAAEVAAMFRSGKPVPDDQTVKQWANEQRLTKYGS